MIYRNLFSIVGTAITNFERRLSNSGNEFYLIYVSVPNSEGYSKDKVVSLTLFPQNKKINPDIEIKGKLVSFSGFLSGMPCKNNGVINTLILSSLSILPDELIKENKESKNDLPF